jgi:hypothetical protein
VPKRRQKIVKDLSDTSGAAEGLGNSPRPSCGARNDETRMTNDDPESVFWIVIRHSGFVIPLRP